MPHQFYVSTDKSKLRVDIIEDFLANRSYWAQGRSRRTITKAIENSLCFGVYNDAGEQAGFARVVTDYAVFAWIMDVFILEQYRKHSLAKILMHEIMGHPDLQGLQRWGLATRDAHGLYEKYGFSIVARPDQMMEKTSSPS